MLTCSVLGNYGRLGNQLFQISILLSIQEKTGFEIKLPDLNNREWHGQPCLLNNFNISAKTLDSSDKILFQYSERKEDEFQYNPSIYNISDNTDIFGFFQHGKYYENCFDLIKKELSLKDEILFPNIEKINKIKEKYKSSIVSLHLRRGDASGNMYGSNNNTLDKNSLWFQYFEKAKKQFENKKIKFLLFTGGIRNEDPSIEYDWCRNNFKGDEYIILDEQRDTINDFSLIQCCDHHILSPSSSFSYMTGFLNKDKVKEGKIIVAPKNYLHLEKEMSDGFYPKEFILI